jgi:hypothetical protein
MRNSVRSTNACWKNDFIRQMCKKKKCMPWQYKFNLWRFLSLSLLFISMNERRPSATLNLGIFLVSQVWQIHRLSYMLDTLWFTEEFIVWHPSRDCYCKRMIIPIGVFEIRIKNDIFTREMCFYLSAVALILCVVYIHWYLLLNSA